VVLRSEGRAPALKEIVIPRWTAQKIGVDRLIRVSAEIAHRFMACNSRQAEMLLLDAERFLDRWLSTGHAMGWTTLDLFGIHPIRPAVRVDVMGFLLPLQGGEVIALTAEGASIRRPSGAVSRFPRRPLTACRRSCMTLIPYDKREGIPLNVAAERAGKSPGTIRNWRIEHGIGRRVQMP